MMLTIGNAPLSWGVFEGDDPANPPWDRVLDEIAMAGYRWTELGPIGFLPEDAGTLRAELDQRSLRLTGGFVYERLGGAPDHDAVLRNARRVCEQLSGQGAKHLVVIDRMVPDRQRTAGRSEHAERLDDNAWDAMIDLILQVARLAHTYDLRPVLHPHCGSHIEFADEIDRALGDLPPADIGLCIDTGHSAAVGIQASDLVRRYPDRIEYFHLKDVDATALERMRTGTSTFDEALGFGLFCPLGQGVVDFVALRAALVEIGFSGHATVEQDPDPQLKNVNGLESATASHGYLTAVGLLDAPPEHSQR